MPSNVSSAMSIQSPLDLLIDQIRDLYSAESQSVLTLPELAAFANCVMARYLDGNDAFPNGGGHPSDTISSVLGGRAGRRRP